MVDPEIDHTLQSAKYSGPIGSFSGDRVSPGQCLYSHRAKEILSEPKNPITTANVININISIHHTVSKYAKGETVYFIYCVHKHLPIIAQSLLVPQFAEYMFIASVTQASVDGRHFESLAYLLFN